MTDFLITVSEANADKVRELIDEGLHLTLRPWASARVYPITHIREVTAEEHSVGERNAS